MGVDVIDLVAAYARTTGRHDATQIDQNMVSKERKAPPTYESVSDPAASRNAHGDAPSSSSENTDTCSSHISAHRYDAQEDIVLIPQAGEIDHFQWWRINITSPRACMFAELAAPLVFTRDAHLQLAGRQYEREMGTIINGEQDKPMPIFEA